MSQPAATGPAYRRQIQRAQAQLERVPGSRHVLTTFDRDRRSGGALLAGALAFRLFAVLLPAALLLAVGLGYASTVQRGAAQDAGKSVGIAATAIDSVASASRLSATSRWLLVGFGVFALLYAAIGASKAIHAAHSLAWTGAVDRRPKPLPAALLFVATFIVLAAIWGGVNRVRAEDRGLGVLVALIALIPFCAVWLLVSMRLPHGEAPWRALVPGALLVGIGFELIHLGTVLFIAKKVQHASATYGPLGASFTILAWLFIVSRVIVASAMLNAVLWARRQAGQ